ncbi:hypothetical protein OAN21_00220 [Alphaproteobacteria bacterium]|nr:hypothetical protein [Alphaproteobacteria bacterium]
MFKYFLAFFILFGLESISASREIFKQELDRTLSARLPSARQQDPSAGTGATVRAEVSSKALRPFHVDDYLSHDWIPTNPARRAREIKETLVSSETSLVISVSPNDFGGSHPLNRLDLEKESVILLDISPPQTHNEWVPRSISVDFNSIFFHRGVSRSLEEAFSTIYFDWSTFKFVRKDALQSIGKMMKPGGEVIIVSPINAFYFLLEEGETNEDFQKLPIEIKRQRNLEEKRKWALETLNESGNFLVKTTKVSEGKRDPVFDAILENYKNHEGKPAIDLMVIRKKPTVAPKPTIL